MPGTCSHLVHCGLICLGFVFSVSGHVAHLIGSSSPFEHAPPHGLFGRSSNLTQQIFYGRFISTPTPDQVLIQNGAVLVTGTNGTGTIQQASWNVTDPNDAAAAFGVGADVPVIQAADNGFFFPGFIDSHIHASQYPNLGLFEGTLLNWLMTYTFPMEASLGNTTSPAWNNISGPHDPYARAMKVYAHNVARTLAYGTTTASYYATVDVPATNLLATIAYTMGQRAYIGRTCMDNQVYNPPYYRDESAEDALNKTLATINYIRSIDPQGQLVAPIVTPRFAPSVTPESMTLLASLAQSQDLRLQMHLAENVGEVALVAKLYPNQTSYAGVYDEYGLLTNRTILAHAVHLSDAEMRLVASQGSKIAHCPASNSALGSGLARVREMINAGIDVGLGTDQAGGYSPSLLETVRQAFLVGRLREYLNGGNTTYALSIAESLYLGTMGGAKVVGMAGKLGGFEQGMLWDVQEVVLNGTSGPVDILGWETWPQQVDKWVWNGDDRNVNRVWVGGRLVKGM